MGPRLFCLSAHDYTRLFQNLAWFRLPMHTIPILRNSPQRTRKHPSPKPVCRCLYDFIHIHPYWNLLHSIDGQMAEQGVHIHIITCKSATERSRQLLHTLAQLHRKRGLATGLWVHPSAGRVKASKSRKRGGGGENPDRADVQRGAAIPFFLEPAVRKQSGIVIRYDSRCKLGHREALRGKCALEQSFHRVSASWTLSPAKMETPQPSNLCTDKPVKAFVVFPVPVPVRCSNTILLIYYLFSYLLEMWSLCSAGWWPWTYWVTRLVLNSN